jgi:hypothetical protein
MQKPLLACRGLETAKKNAFLKVKSHFSSPSPSFPSTSHPSLLSPKGVPLFNLMPRTAVFSDVEFRAGAELVPNGSNQRIGLSLFQNPVAFFLKNGNSSFYAFTNIPILKGTFACFATAGGQDSPSPDQQGKSIGSRGRGIPPGQLANRAPSAVASKKKSINWTNCCLVDGAGPNACPPPHPRGPLRRAPQHVADAMP